VRPQTPAYPQVCRLLAYRSRPRRLPPTRGRARQLLLRNADFKLGRMQPTAITPGPRRDNSVKAFGLSIELPIRCEAREALGSPILRKAFTTQGAQRIDAINQGRAG